MKKFTMIALIAGSCFAGNVFGANLDVDATEKLIKDDAVNSFGIATIPRPPEPPELDQKQDSKFGTRPRPPFPPTTAITMPRPPRPPISLDNELFAIASIPRPPRPPEFSEMEHLGIVAMPRPPRPPQVTIKKEFLDKKRV